MDPSRVIAFLTRSALIAGLLLTASTTTVAQTSALAEPGEESPAAADPTLNVELLEAGAAPRETLRFTPTKGTKQTVVMTMDMQQQMTINGNPLPAPKLPVQKITIQFEVKGVTPAGDSQLGYEYTQWEVVREEGVQPAVADQIEKLLKPMIGTTGSVTVSNRGFPSENDVEIPAGVAPQLRAMVDGMKQSMDRLGAPLPEEPVGVGGKWRVSAEVVANGVTVDQVSTYELLSADNGVYSLGITIDQLAKKQKVNPPGLPPGAEIELTSLDSTGQGKMTLGKDLVVPRKSDMQLKSSSDMQVNAGGATQKMNVDMEVTMTIGPPGESSEGSPGESGEE